MITEQQLGIYACERLKLPMSERLRMQSYISTALSDLARKTVNDYTKRKLLLTDRSVVTSTITSSNGTYYSDISTVISSFGVMPDYLAYGIVFVNAPAYTWASGAVDPPSIGIVNHGYGVGQAVRLTTAGTLPSPLVINTTYYIAVINANAVGLSLTASDAFAGIDIPLTTTGTGNSTMTPYGEGQVLQWIDVPAFANLEMGGTPIPFAFGWVLENRIYLSGVTAGTLSYSVPFTPSMSNFNGSNASLSLLEQDLIDSVVSIAVSAGLEPNVSQAI